MKQTAAKTRNAEFNKLLGRWVTVDPVTLLIKAMHAQPTAPCDKGCVFVERCKAEHLACNNFHRYVCHSSNIKKKRFPGIPDRKTYNMVFKMKDDDE